MEDKIKCLGKSSEKMGLYYHKEVRQLERQIDSMKCCGNCENKTGATHCIIYKSSDHPIVCNDWKFKELI